ncbi:hypothetical protein MRX96_038254 [Rhipicephalus microplus]
MGAILAAYSRASKQGGVAKPYAPIALLAAMRTGSVVVVVGGGGRIIAAGTLRAGSLLGFLRGVLPGGRLARLGAGAVTPSADSVSFFLGERFFLGGAEGSPPFGDDGQRLRPLVLLRRDEHALSVPPLALLAFAAAQLGLRRQDMAVPFVLGDPLEEGADADAREHRGALVDARRAALFGLGDERAENVERHLLGLQRVEGRLGAVAVVGRIDHRLRLGLRSLLALLLRGLLARLVHLLGLVGPLRPLRLVRVGRRLLGVRLLLGLLALLALL